MHITSALDSLYIHNKSFFSPSEKLNGSSREEIIDGAAAGHLKGCERGMSW